MILRPPRPTRTATLFPYTTLFRSMTDDVTVHAHLIVRQGSRADFNTPVLVLDEGALDRNIAAMAALAKAHGVGLRPHAKTHKSVDIARRQIAAGARSEEHTSALQSLMRISYAVFCLQKKKY